MEVHTVADKDKELTREQKAWIASQGLLPSQYEVLQDCPHSMLVRHKVTKEAHVIDKD